MKNTASQPDLPTAAPAKKAPDPVLDPGKAKSVPAYRQPASARTVAYHQPAEKEGFVDLFGATGTYAATVPAKEAAANEPAPAVEPKPAS